MKTKSRNKKIMKIKIQIMKLLLQKIEIML